VFLPTLINMGSDSEKSGLECRITFHCRVYDAGG